MLWIYIYIHIYIYTYIYIIYIYIYIYIYTDLLHIIYHYSEFICNDAMIKLFKKN